MKNLTMDSSVFIKMLIEEELTPIAIRLFEYIDDNNIEIINPTLFEYEVIKVCITNNVDLDAVNSVLSDHKKANLTLIQPSALHHKKAKEIIASCKKENGFPSYYDAIYHAMALVEGGTLVTADEKYYTKTKHLGGVLLLDEGMMEGV